MLRLESLAATVTYEDQTASYSTDWELIIFIDYFTLHINHNPQKTQGLLFQWMQKKHSTERVGIFIPGPEHMNFGQTFIHYIKTLYINATKPKF